MEFTAKKRSKGKESILIVMQMRGALDRGNE